MSQAAVQQPSRKKAVISLLVLLALTCIIVFTFKDHWAEITAALAQLSVWQVLAVLAVGISYPLLEGCVAWVIVRSRLPQFKLWQGLDVGWCGTFGNVVTLGAGAVPVQLYYLHKVGLPTFYGQAFLPDVCELGPAMLPYTERYFAELLRTGTIREVTPSDVWYESRTDFSPSQIGIAPAAHPDDGFQLLQGSPTFSGEILGGCIDTFYDFFDGTR